MGDIIGIGRIVKASWVSESCGVNARHAGDDGCRLFLKNGECTSKFKNDRYRQLIAKTASSITEKINYTSFFERGSYHSPAGFCCVRL